MYTLIIAFVEIVIVTAILFNRKGVYVKYI
jgi:hypothetical protein